MTWLIPIVVDSTIAPGVAELRADGNVVAELVFDAPLAGCPGCGGARDDARLRWCPDCRRLGAGILDDVRWRP